MYEPDELTEKMEKMEMPIAAVPIEHIARACHEANRVYCNALGDFSQLSWEYAPQWQKDSAIAGVKFVIENPVAGCSAQHDSWMKMKTEEGWKWGPFKSEELKTHPCYLPYEELPVEQQLKDLIFQRTVLLFIEVNGVLGDRKT